MLLGRSRRQTDPWALQWVADPFTDATDRHRHPHPQPRDRRGHRSTTRTSTSASTVAAVVRLAGSSPHTWRPPSRAPCTSRRAVTSPSDRAPAVAAHRAVRVPLRHLPTGPTGSSPARSTPTRSPNGCATEITRPGRRDRVHVVDCLGSPTSPTHPRSPRRLLRRQQASAIARRPSSTSRRRCRRAWSEPGAQPAASQNVVDLDRGAKAAMVSQPARRALRRPHRRRPTGGHYGLASHLRAAR